ncbi:CYTH domain-containing protein [Paenibacillus sp. 7541]|uniref:CYTH domain-containing protein n=1 Tax=Paenibacillus TaxID=44249 RepID=UPI000BA71208|nr:CYTH domain-containing protein [Paenibacillus sp. 7541]PAK54986.1 adenylate cyclase [Paenibacillus sp. 7541]
MAVEIERKFLLNEYPEALIEEGSLVVEKEQLIEQTYLALDEDQELRVRKMTDAQTGKVEYTHTFKKGWGLARDEIEYAISAGLYEQVVQAHGAIPLIKRRVTARWGEQLVEIDEYSQIDLLVLEVEFPTLEAATSFAPPAWFGKDISEEKQYSNKKVWRELQTGREEV